MKALHQAIRLTNRLWTASIRRQLMVGIALVHAVMMTVFVFDLVHRQRQFLVQESTNQAIALAETLAANGVSWVLARDFVGLEEVVASQAKFPDLRYAMFTDLSGQVLGYTDRTQVGRFADDPTSRRLLTAEAKTQILLNQPAQVDVAHPVFSNGRHIGWARVGVGRDRIADNLGLVTREGLAYTLVAILVGVVFAALMARGLTGDIRQLAAFSNDIREGARGKPLGVDRPDELGDLAQDMLRMRDDLADRESKLAEANVRLHASEERLRFALEGASDGLWDWDVEGDTLYLSPRWKQMLGYEEHELRSEFETWLSLIHPDDIASAKASVQAHLESPDKPYELLHRLQHKDGTWRWVLSRGMGLVTRAGSRPHRMVGTHVDVTHTRRLEEVLRAEREKALVTLHSIGDGVITTLADGSIDYLNPVAEALTGWRLDEARGRALEEVFPVFDEKTNEAVPNPVDECLRKNRVIGLGGHTRLRNKSGQELSIEDSAAPIRDNEGALIGVVLVFHDVTEARSLQKQLEHQAMHDELTGLWSRRAFDLRLAEVTEHARNEKLSHTLVYIDLDQFKIVNDTVGHLAGDELLRQVSSIFERHIRSSDMLARLGGDEFGILLIGCPVQQAIPIAETLREEIRDYRFCWKDQVFQIGASFGLASVDATLTESNALSLADLACYSAKEAGRNRVHVFRPDDNALAERRSEMQWVARIKAALDSDRFVLHGQPIRAIAAGDGLTDHLEILVRMVDESGKVVPPNAFIPAAERFDLMSDIDLWVVEHAIAWMRAEGNEGVSLAINLSGTSLDNPRVVDAIERELDAHPRIGRRLCFEITETAAIGNLGIALQFMQRLKRRHVRFALDDFGSGLSSFSYLKTLPVDFIKIDGSFVRDLLDDPVDAAMVESIARVSLELGLQTIAEFVESEAILAEVQRLGIHFAQGYAVGRPAPLRRRAKAATA